MLRSTINSQMTPMSGGFKERTQVAAVITLLKYNLCIFINCSRITYKICLQIKNVWDGELQNIVQMSFGMSTPPSCLEIDGTIETTPLPIQNMS